FAVPQANIVELVSYFGKKEVNTHVEGKMQNPMVRVRGQLLPLIPLGRILVRSGPGRHYERELERVLEKQELNVVVLQADEHRFGLEVEEIIGPSSLVIKPMNPLFSEIAILSGTAVMPDGTVSFLLNVPELYAME
ncbi:MAG: chemotaxis protein CheW, partial [Magnetococcales bacterium]|nr:chemotaxis protein CheW [Magnetococcales bacterium]